MILKALLGTVAVVALLGGPPKPGKCSVSEVGGEPASSADPVLLLAGLALLLRLRPPVRRAARPRSE